MNTIKEIVLHFCVFLKSYSNHSESQSKRVEKDFEIEKCLQISAMISPSF